MDSQDESTLLNEDDDDYLTMALPDLSSSLISTRERKVYAQRERGICKSYQVREHERRKEALSSSLMDFEKPSKAMTMMFKMGYRKGEALGQKQSEGKLEPLEINMKTDRLGIGHKTMQKQKIEQEIQKIRENEIDYESRMRLEREKKYLEAKVLEAQKVCENLDKKESLDEPRKINVLWRGLVVQRIEKEMEKRRRHGIFDRPEDSQDFLSDEIKPPRHTHIEWNEDEDMELYAFNQLDPGIRLEKILDFLRQNYNYCFWCGYAYQNEEELSTYCPGKKEEDH
ncbi:hypothetical protein PNEG_00149 [Pneumocystis murina B123]|uniref:G-patch domain-containing protein n=1 Tax=Pneumocystis murina (strain B123) TaxID=1069680 RepID=M7PCT3_PNEMU|nr:hypothetical protein PNEG_00149 [Pneumocystis murina B123]EMR11715.1 hypothetical protein PNEG_00149 [Pneumocystis murina B123]